MNSALPDAPAEAAEALAHPPLTHLRMAAYALPSLPTSIALLPLALFLPAFFARDLGVPLASVGVAIGASRLLDVVTDPLIGVLSDRLPTRFGRRKPWLVLGTPLFLFALWRLFVPAEGAGFRYLLGWSAALYLGFTLMDLPYKAWGAELSVTYDERSRVTAWREGIGAGGQVALLGFLVVLGARGLNASAEQLFAVAVTVTVVLPIVIALAVTLVPERRSEDWRPTSLGAVEGLRLIARNPAFLRMVAAVLLFVTGVVIQGTLHRLVLADVIGAEKRFPLMLLIENAATLVAVPFWVRLSDRIGKHRALALAALWLALLSIPLMRLGPGDANALVGWIALRGSSFVAILLLANSIAADVIDEDTLASGRQRTGLFFAVWGMMTKLALALGVLLGTALPAAVGYDPTAEVIPSVIQGRLMTIYGGVPALLMGAGALFLWGFPVTRERHREVRAQIEARLRERPG